MIYDCFTFFNEFDLLEVRLRELDPVVDVFVLAEATRTFSGTPKPLYFEENKEHFWPYLHKIRHIIVDDMPDDPDPWKLESHQRRSLARGLVGLDDMDVVIVTDADEILRHQTVASLPDHPAQVSGFRLALSYFRFNYRHTLPQEIWGMAVRGALRSAANPGSPFLVDP